MEHGTVGGGTASDAKTLHHALKSFSLRDANDIDQLAFRKGGRVNDITYIEGRGINEADLGEDARSVFEAGLFGMADFAGGCILFLFEGKAKLDGIVAVNSDSLDLDHRAGSGFDYGDGNEHVLRVVYLRHAEFLT